MKKCLLGVLFAAVAPVVAAQTVYADVESGLLSVFPAGSIDSVAKADTALIAAQEFDASTQARYIEVQRACHGQFFSQRCLDSAKDDYRATINAINEVSVEANRFKRQARADDRGQALEERNARRAAEQKQ